MAHNILRFSANVYWAPMCAECCALAFIYVLTIILGTYWLHFTNYTSGMISSDMVSFVWIIPSPNNPLESVFIFAPIFCICYVENRDLNWAPCSQVEQSVCSRIGFLSAFCGDWRLKETWGPYCEEHCVALSWFAYPLDSFTEALFPISQWCKSLPFTQISGGN